MSRGLYIRDGLEVVQTRTGRVALISGNSLGFEIDDVTRDVLALCDGRSADAVVKALQDRYGEEEIRGALGELEAVGALVGHIQKSYAARTAAKEGHPPPSLDIAVVPPSSSWEPPPAKISRFRWLRGVRLFFGALGESFSPYSAAYKVTPSPLQNRESVRTAAGMMLAQLLAPELHAAFAPPAPPDAAPSAGPRLEIEPLFVGISGYDVAITKLRITLRRADGTAFEFWEAEGTCEPSPVTQCTIRRQLETISDKLRQELPISLVAAAISEKPLLAPATETSPNPPPSE